MAAHCWDAKVPPERKLHTETGWDISPLLIHHAAIEAMPRGVKHTWTQAWRTGLGVVQLRLMQMPEPA